MSVSDSHRLSWGDYINYAVLAALTAFMLYPFVYVFSNSISSLDAVTDSKVVLWPIGFSTDAYRAVFGAATVVRGYLNSLFYTVLGTAANLTMAFLAGYVLAEKTFR